ncbi:hypothetical protein [Streptomyces alkaliphilus]|uniref:Uncharacterized protein n=1 Tax=Streptomyces alkaliphilus TaxID=1472722 RepID=A0A646IBD8_9ACTN|nr:hypothetical protein [Streptomyces alkaliphilus]MQS06914.1 hypothetical protein [Streptomyces alkaliphilus]
MNPHPHAVMLGIFAALFLLPGVLLVLRPPTSGVFRRKRPRYLGVALICVFGAGALNAIPRLLDLSPDMVLAASIAGAVSMLVGCLFSYLASRPGAPTGNPTGEKVEPSTP